MSNPEENRALSCQARSIMGEVRPKSTMTKGVALLHAASIMQVLVTPASFGFLIAKVSPVFRREARTSTQQHPTSVVS